MNKALFKKYLLLLFISQVFSCATLDIVSEEDYFIEEKIVRLNYFDHFIDIRGTKRSNPILLILHGGPGWTIDSITKKLFKDLEKDFTIVNWHQRGAGRSKSTQITPDQMTIDVFLKDTYELINLLRKEFNQDKVVLLGHSWGTILGSLTAKNHPELLYAYIGVSQMTNTKEMIESCKEEAIIVANEMGEETKVVKIKRMNLFSSNPNWYRDTIRFRDLMTELGGTIFGSTRYTPFLKFYIEDRDYRLWEKYNIYRGIGDSVYDLFPDMLSMDLYTEVKSLEIPYYIIQGEHDMLSRAEHSYKFYSTVSAPAKRYFLFEKSAHSPLFEEYELFIDIMRTEVIPLCDEEARYVKKN